MGRSKKKAQNQRPAILSEAYRRVDDLEYCVCGRCRFVRSELERKVSHETNSELEISIDHLLKTEIFCRKAGVLVAPLESSCYMWRPAQNTRTIIVTYQWSQDQKF